MALLSTRSWGGGGQRTAVLVHGVTSSSGTWRRVGPAMAERGWSVTAVDLRGHGASPRGHAGLQLADLAADLAETLRAGPGVPVELLLGHSLGALTVMTLVAAEPDVARLVVLEDPPCTEGVDWDAIVADAERDARRARTDRDALRAELLAPPWSYDPADADTKIASLLALDVDALVAGRGGLDFDVAAMAAKVGVPTLLFLGREDLGSALTGQARAATATALPHGWTEVLDCGHSVHREAFDSYMRRLDAWLDRVDAYGRPAM